jgi:hypothetical protein
MARQFSPITNNIVTDGLAVTTSDTVDLTDPCRGFYVGVSGNVKVRLLGGSEVTFLSMAVGWHPVAVVRFYATGTTATNIIACY